MSHFTKIKTKLVKKEYLIKALKDLGYTVREGQVKIKGYGGRETEVDMMVPTDNPGYELGFKKTGDAYDLVADWYGIKGIKPDDFINKVQQRYAYCAVTERLTEQAFEVVEERNEEDNSIHLTLRRAVY